MCCSNISADSNPEAIIIGSPLDLSDNPSTTKLGDSLEDITGIVTYAYGYYAILPLTALVVTSSLSPANAPPATLVSAGSCSGITIGDYNIENLAPTSTWLPNIADHIANYLNSPDLMFVQEIQDDNGAKNTGGRLRERSMPNRMAHLTSISSRGLQPHSYHTRIRNCLCRWSVI